MDSLFDLRVQLTEAAPSDAAGVVRAKLKVKGDEAGDWSGEFHLVLPQEELTELAWYLEEYWKWPVAEFKTRGAAVEALLPQLGKRLYDALLPTGEALSMFRAWEERAKEAGARQQISIMSTLPALLSLPWELLHDGQGFLALRKRRPFSIVRRISLLDEGEAVPFVPPLRVLLVTARPDDASFVDPRGIAREMLDEVQAQVEEGAMVVEMLRPPTLAALDERLGDPTKPPVHVLHFDGHGAFLQAREYYKDGHRLTFGAHGELAFEDDEGKLALVDAEKLGTVLNRGGVRLAVLTACQSAMGAADDVFSSVAARLVKSGIDGVVAMSASVLVASATRYVEGFYRFLAKGDPVPTAHERARQALYADPRRHPFRVRPTDEAQPITLSDWWLPHYYQQRPITFSSGSPSAVSPPPPLTPSSPPPFNDRMPDAPRYGFHGRAWELWQMERALVRGKLVVLHGFGGVGKTALAREAAAWLTRTRLFGAAYFHPFEQGSDAGALLSGLATFLDMNDSGFRADNVPDALARLRPALAEQRPLVIADNLESILDGGNAPLEGDARKRLWTVLVALRDSGAGVLLTTRTPHFQDTRLAEGSRVSYRRLAGLRPEDAYALATELLQSLEIPRERAPYAEVRDLLVQLDHHPLAIQLVLPALREYPLHRIRDDFAALLPRFRDDNESGRNQSLLASLEYSIHRLTDAQRTLLPRLAVFEGGASEDDLLVITEIPEHEWSDLRTALEHAALVRPERIHEAIIHPFLHFHPVLTPYLRTQPGADDPALSPRHAARYHALAQYLYQEDNRNPIPARALFLRELPNLRRAFAFLVAQRDAEAASDMANSLSYFLGHLGLGRERDEVRRAVQPLIKEDGEGLTRAEFLSVSGRGEDEYQRGNLQAAYTRFTRLLARITAQPAGSPRGPGSYEHSITLRNLARVLRAGGQPAHAEQRLREALQMLDTLIAQAPDNAAQRRQRGVVLTDLGDVLAEQGKYGEAKVAYENSLESKQTIGGDKRGEGVVLAQLGTLALRQRQFEEAKRRYQEALALFRTLDEPASEATLWHQLGIVVQEQKQWAEAERAYRESLAIEERLGNSAGAAQTCNQLAIVAEGAGRLDEAEGWCQRAIEIAEQLGDTKSLAGRLNNLAGLLLASNTRLAEARGYAERALAIRERLDASSEIWMTLGILADIADKQGDRAAARAYRRRERESFAAFAGNRWHIDQQHGRLIAAISAAVQGNASARATAEAWFPRMEAVDDWRKTPPAIQRLWVGERDWHTLTDELMGQPTLLILRVLETLADPAAAPQVPDAPQQSDFLEEFEPLLQGIAAAAQGAADVHQEIEELLPKLEAQGWRIADPVRRIWAGERDAAALTQGLDAQDSALVRRVLAILDSSQTTAKEETEEEAEQDPGARIGALLGSLPNEIRHALQQGDAAAFQRALQALPQEEQMRVLATLMEVQRLSSQ